MSFFFWDINFRKFIAKIKIHEKKKKPTTTTTTKVCVGREQNSKRKLQASICTSNARQNWLALNYIPDNSAIVASFSSPLLCLPLVYYKQEKFIRAITKTEVKLRGDI